MSSLQLLAVEGANALDLLTSILFTRSFSKAPRLHKFMKKYGELEDGHLQSACDEQEFVLGKQRLVGPEDAPAPKEYTPDLLIEPPPTSDLAREQWYEVKFGMDLTKYEGTQTLSILYFGYFQVDVSWCETLDPRPFGKLHASQLKRFLSKQSVGPLSFVKRVQSFLLQEAKRPLPIVPGRASLGDALLLPWSRSCELELVLSILPCAHGLRPGKL